MKQSEVDAQRIEVLKQKLEAQRRLIMRLQKKLAMLQNRFDALR